MESDLCPLFQRYLPPFDIFSLAAAETSWWELFRPPLLSRLCWGGTSRAAFENQISRTDTSLPVPFLLKTMLLWFLLSWSLVTSEISTVEIDSQGDVIIPQFMEPQILATRIFQKYKIFSGSGKGRGFLNQPIGVTYCDHLIFVADADNHRIQAFHENGSFAYKIGGLEAGYKIGEQFKYPHGLSCHAGLLYVADTENSRIQIFHTNGTYVNMFARRRDCYYSELGFPHASVVCDGIISILDTYNHRMQLYPLDLSRIRRIGEMGPETSNFHYPEDIACANHSIFIADTHNHRVQVFSSSGDFLRIYELISNFPSAVTVCNGRLFVNDPEYHRITEYSLWTGEFIMSIGTEGNGKYQFRGIGGLFCSDGVLFVTDTKNNRIHIIPFHEIIRRELLEGFRLDRSSGVTISSEYDTTMEVEDDNDDEEEEEDESERND
jgi:hypothetical protein